ncbi:CarD-like transcriptional regulator [Moritella viscosa]|uniref:hypothetical protein n=1 Tax=Moritella viscosa TaxID=80854 RepID=UPI0009203974|nr:hypothetical protein [Moritella viscosa]SHO23521.1 CarD-like transcriptional regulator [Moritella viscosa]
MIFEWSSVQQIRTVIDRIAGTELEWPPENDGVYIVTFNHWENQPTSKAKQSKAKPLYFGGTTGNGNRFCTRVGDLIADI